MKTLRNPNAFIVRTLGQQIAEPGVLYRWSPCLIREGNAIYNALTGEAVTVEDMQKDRAALFRRWFLIPADMDIKAVAKMLRQKALQLKSGPGANKKHSYVIFTTTACNARCKYCFEQGMDTINMDDKTAAEVAEYIERTVSGEEVKLKWFGGEPLVNKDAINAICAHLSEHGLKYRSNMSTNGDLLPQCTDEELKLWDLKDVQLTLDDVGAEYERIKGLPSGAYDRLVESVKRLGSLGIHISMRIHLHPENGAAPCHRIIDAFKDEKHVKMYVRIIYDRMTQETYDVLISIEDRLIELGKMRASLPRIELGNHCMADNRQISCITPDGHLSPCEHYATEHLYGTIHAVDAPLVLQQWGVMERQAKNCDCPLYPTCRKLLMCPAEGKCDDGYKYYQIETIKRALRRATL